MIRKGITLNRPQTLHYLVEANTTYNVWGRGAGKSTGLFAPRMDKLIKELPQSLHVIGAATYAQLLERTLPPVITALEQWGWIRDVNYTFGKQPPKAWNWPKPLVAPLKWDHTFYFNTGTVFQLISQDRPGSANGISAVSGLFDEAKFLNYQKHLEEIAPIFRGNLERYGDHHLYGGMLYCTDMPTMQSAMWILEKEKAMDQRIVDSILFYLGEIEEYRQALHGATTKYKKQLEKKIRWTERAIAVLRKNCIYYSEASAMENLDNLGKGYIKRMRQVLPPALFQTSILNKRLRNLEQSFYAALNEERHTYQAKNNSYLDSLGGNAWEKLDGLYQLRGGRDSRIDADVNPNAPLEIALDYGGHINCLVVGQESNGPNSKVFRTLNCMYVVPPNGLQSLVKQFCEYYRLHKTKRVIYYYDATAYGQNPTGNPHNQVVMDELRKQGWSIEERNFGRPPSHQDKHQFWHDALQGLNPYLPWFLWNRDNCDNLLISMQSAGIRQGRNGFEKDKTSEDIKKGLPQQHATHFSDAMDMLAYYKYRNVWVNQSVDTGGLMIL